MVQTLAQYMDDPNWHEISLLTIGQLSLVQDRRPAASDTLLALLAHSAGPPGQAIVLAGECVADVGPDGVTPACRQAVIDALVQTMRDEGVAPTRRAAAGRTLAHRNLGDPRPAVTTLEAMEFCYVPPGPFVMGSDEDDPLAYNDEKPQHEYTMPDPYWISRFPVTNAQFARFVGAGGYTNADYWREASQHELWQAGQVRDVWYTLSENQTDLVRNVGDWRSGPVEVGEPYNLPNHPIVGVNWYEALAFTRWLTDQLRDRLPANWHITLPNEPEWEKAARGGLTIPAQPTIHPASQLQPPTEFSLIENRQAARPYPWGAEAEVNRLNYEATQIATTSAVGCFPGGASPYGVEELSGNVWEWTRTLWGSDWRTATFGYPYTSSDDREQLGSGVEVLRVIRGGSFYNDARLGRCAVRGRYYPVNRYGNFGLRVVCAPIPSEL